jgi:hypothetical protein
MTPRGTTYITVGSHGFYYRETISTSRRGGPHPSPQGGARTTAIENSIGTADVLELVDSSNTALIERLNERSRMVNPAWLLYAIAAAVLVWGISLIANSTNPSETPSLPDVTIPLSAERKVNQTDEYSLVLARYGQPNTVVVGSAPLRTAVYDSAHLAVVFVPNGCVDAYEFYASRKENGNVSSAVPNTRHPRSRRSKSARKAPSCAAPPDNGSTIVRYQDAESGSTITNDRAQERLDALGSKSSS